MTVNPALSNFTPQVEQAKNLSQILNRKSISHNTKHRQSLHESEPRCHGCVYKIIKKKRKHSEKRKKNNNLLKTKTILNIKISAKEGPVFAFILPVGAACCPHHSRQLCHC